MAHSTVLVYSNNNDMFSKYQAFANEGGYILQIKEKTQNNLKTLIDQQFNLIVIEIMNPVLSEIEFFDHVYEIVPHVPIIIISRYFFDTKDVLFGKKIRDFIVKPFSLEQLIFCGRKILKESEAQPEIPVEPEASQILHETKKLSILIEISHSINSQRSLDDVLDSIINLASGALEAERATLFIFDRENHELWSRSGTGLKQKEIRIPADKGIAGYVISTGQPQIVDDPYSNKHFNKEVDQQTGFKTKNILCVPLKNVHRVTIGVFQMLNKKNGSFTKDDQEFLSTIAISAGIAIENGLLQEKIRKQYEDVQRSYKDLYISQNQMLKEARFSTTSELIGFLKSEYKLDINSRAAEIKKSYAKDKCIIDFADYVTSFYSNLMTRLDEYITHMEK